MRAVLVVIALELLAPLSDSPPTASPAGIEAVGALFEGLKPFLDVVSVGIVKMTAQSKSGEGSRIAEAIHQKLRIGDIMFLGEAVDERRRGVSPAALTRAKLSFANQNALRSGDG